MYQCLCCGCCTLPVPAEDAAAYICPVCLWENDIFLQADREPSDENHGLTLLQAQRNYRRYGVCDRRLKEYARPPTAAEAPGRGELGEY